MAMFREDFLEEVIFRCVFNGCEEIASKGPREGQGGAGGNHAGPCNVVGFYSKQSRKPLEALHLEQRSDNCRSPL